MKVVKCLGGLLEICLFLQGKLHRGTNTPKSGSVKVTACVQLSLLISPDAEQSQVAVTAGNKI